MYSSAVLSILVHLSAAATCRLQLAASAVSRPAGKVVARDICCIDDVLWCWRCQVCILTCCLQDHSYCLNTGRACLKWSWPFRCISQDIIDIPKQDHAACSAISVSSLHAEHEHQTSPKHEICAHFMQRTSRYDLLQLPARCLW